MEPPGTNGSQGQCLCPVFRALSQFCAGLFPSPGPSATQRCCTPPPYSAHIFLVTLPHSTCTFLDRRIQPATSARRAPHHVLQHACLLQS
eukprot:2554609-Pleurochrysis_carterae.AAC.1